MSREERRQYQRMMKGADRQPGLPPAARARAERTRAKREASRATRTYGLTLRFMVMSLVVATVAGLLGFSLQWPNMPFALYVGIAVAVVAFAILIAIRLLQRRAAGA
ncbi:MAG: hypothetical protein ACRDGV_05460 [Candidatus Limnocylindria bacterium]